MHVFRPQRRYSLNFQLMKNHLLTLSILDPVVSMFYVPDGEGLYTRGSSSQAIFLMGQSLFIIAQLLTAGLLHVNELDPIRRYLPSYNRPRKGGSRYSAFQVSSYFCKVWGQGIRTRNKLYFEILLSKYIKYTAYKIPNM